MRRTKQPCTSNHPVLQERGECQNSQGKWAAVRRLDCCVCFCSGQDFYIHSVQLGEYFVGTSSRSSSCWKGENRCYVTLGSVELRRLIGQRDPARGAVNVEKTIHDGESNAQREWLGPLSIGSESFPCDDRFDINEFHFFRSFAFLLFLLLFKRSFSSHWMRFSLLTDLFWCQISSERKAKDFQPDLFLSWQRTLQQKTEDQSFR